MQIIPISALRDNYIWTIVQAQNAWVIDPGEAQPVQQFLHEEKLKLRGILITHHHHDHTGGIAELLAHESVPVIGPHERISTVTMPASFDSVMRLDGISLQLSAEQVAGHTLGHVVYYDDEVLFCGDTLFSAGCGRVFEGTYAQMYASLQKIAQLGDQLKVYCAHEYTLKNLQFAKCVEPLNEFIDQHIELATRLIADKKPTLPSTLGLEKKINPFLRCHEPNVIERAENYVGKKLRNDVEVFTVLRQWKDVF